MYDLRNHSWFNEPFAVSPFEGLYLDMHGLISETSIWLLAGSTRLFTSSAKLRSNIALPELSLMVQPHAVFMWSIIIVARVRLTRSTFTVIRIYTVRSGIHLTRLTYRTSQSSLLLQIRINPQRIDSYPTQALNVEASINPLHCKTPETRKRVWKSGSATEGAQCTGVSQHHIISMLFFNTSIINIRNKRSITTWGNQPTPWWASHQPLDRMSLLERRDWIVCATRTL